MEVIKINLENINKPSIINRLKTVISEGNLLVYPTDTLYGLGADPYNPDCISKINEVKGRAEQQNISISFVDVEEIGNVIDVSAILERAVEELLPGPVTLIVHASSGAPKPVVSNTGTIGIRIPDNPLTSELLKITGPLTSTSANRHGGKEPEDIQTAISQLGNEVSLYLDSGPCKYKIYSTIIDLTDETPKILREGYIKRNVIEEKLGFRVDKNGAIG